MGCVEQTILDPPPNPYYELLNLQNPSLWTMSYVFYKEFQCSHIKLYCTHKTELLITRKFFFFTKLCYAVKNKLLGVRFPSLDEHGYLVMLNRTKPPSCFPQIVTLLTMIVTETPAATLESNIQKNVAMLKQPLILLILD